MNGDPPERTDTSERAVAASVTVYPNGPLVLRGDFEVRHVDGSAVPTGRLVALCRCGRSALKPLCDGSHKTGPPAAPVRRPPETEPLSGPGRGYDTPASSVGAD